MIVVCSRNLDKILKVNSKKSLHLHSKEIFLNENLETEKVTKKLKFIGMYMCLFAVEPRQLLKTCSSSHVINTKPHQKDHDSLNQEGTIPQQTVMSKADY